MVAVLIPAAGAVAAGPKEGAALTVYPRFGVVSETRELEIPPDGEVTVTNVAALIDPTTVRFESLTDPAAKVLEQNFQYDVVSSWRLLEKYVGKHVVLRGEKESYSGTLLSFEDAGGIWEHGGVFAGRPGPMPAGVILMDKSGSLLSVSQEEIRSVRFGEMPKGLRTRPTLLWKVATKKPGGHLANFTYQTDGLAWHAEYTLVVDQKDERADLSGWVSVENYSGKTYASTRLKFIAGERKQTDYQVEHGQYWMKESIEIIVRNHKEEGVAVRIKEPMYREQNWAITAKSRDYVKLDSRTVAWDVQVPKDGETKVTYTVEYTW